MIERVLSRLGLGPILLLGFALRVIWVLLCPNEPTSDQGIYHFAATELAAGHGYVDESGEPANFWPVGYSAILAPAYAVFGARPTTAFAVNLWLWMLAIAGTYRLGRECFGENAGRLAALIVAVHPTFVLHTTMFASETPFCAGLPWALWLLLQAMRDDERAGRYAIASGLLIGLLVYVRPPALLFLACPLAFGLIARAPLARVAQRFAFVLVAAFLVLLPWGIRNQAAFGQFSIMSFNGGSNLWMGNNPESDGSYMPMPAELDHLSQRERDAVLKDRAIDFIVSHPGEYAMLTLRRVVVSLRSDTIAGEWNAIGLTKRFGERGVLAAKLICTAAHWALLLGCLFGLLIFPGGPYERIDLELLVVAAMIAVPFVLIVGGNRYMVPILPVLSIWCASRLRSSWRAPFAPRTPEVARA
jgi:4-amino-4-deoxy-L-arabinose transferase-like glycosyltransferase